MTAPSEQRTQVRRRRPDPVTTVVVIATALFALAGIGSPLLGLGVFADTGSLARYSGYRDVMAGVEVQHGYLRDQVDAALPNSILFGQALRSGEFATWNPYPLGGNPLNSNPNLALASPISLPFWILPGWLAPAYVKLLELICAIGGAFLFLRQLRLSRAAAWLGGLVFASSAFMVTWTGWPQTRVACLIPALFWGIERLARRPGVREVGLVGLAVAAMLLGGFPAVTGYALLTGSAYLLVRVLAEHPVRTQWRSVARRLVAGALGVVAGVGLAAWQLVPWVQYMTTVFVEGRAQDPNQFIPTTALLTAIAPYAFGTVNPGHPPDYFGPLELVDASAYIGAAATVLAIAAIALARPARAWLPRGVWWLLVAASAVWAVVIFFGGPMLALLQHTSFLFSDNFVGRARSVLGFLVAVLAAVGFDLLYRGQPSRGDRVASRRTRANSIARLTGWVALGAGFVALYLAGRRLAKGDAFDHVGYFDRQVLIGLVLVAIAAGCATWLWFGPRRAPRRWVRPAVVALLPVLVAGQGLWWVQSYYPRTDRSAFYPANPTQRYLAANLGHQRYFGADGAIFGSVDVTARLRSFHGHGFIEQGYADLAAAMPGKQFATPTTAILSDTDDAPAVAVSPVLDRAAVSHFVVPPEVAPIGRQVTEPDDGTSVDLRPGQPVTLRLPVTGPLRGIGVTPVAGTAQAAPTDILGPGSDKERKPVTLAVSPVASAQVRVILRDQAG
ncbi:MAG TPA: hypothetical protein VF163_10935, partial [Micromonosporaceae bacterium]